MEKKEFQEMAEALIAEHIPGWTFAFGNRRKAIGLCIYSQKKILVSKHWVPILTPEEAGQVVLHEIAHALAGPGHGHDAVWKITAKRIGYTGGSRSDIDLNRIGKSGVFPWAVFESYSGKQVGAFARRPSKTIRDIDRMGTKINGGFVYGTLVVCRRVDDQWQEVARGCHAKPKAA